MVGNGGKELEHGAEVTRRAGGAQIVLEVEPGSIAEELGICPGDRLVAVDGSPVRDVFAYRLAVLESSLTIEIEKADGEHVVYEIEKDEDETLGMEFADPLMDKSNHCHNKCIFCFIDQLPPGMRDTLYFKDDDMRLSFLTGNYITLTNMNDEELDRLIHYHLSPMNISVHTTDPELRKTMLKNPRSTRIMDQLEKIVAAGIELNCQIVLCPGVNDGPALDRTLSDLSRFGESIASIAVVPVGVTRYREQNGLFPLVPFDDLSAAVVISQVERWQAYFKEKMGRRIFYAADEFYLRSGLAVPPAEEYEDMAQLENGVGMLALFKEEIEDGLEQRRLEQAGETDEPAYGAAPRALYGELPEQVDEVHILTGTDAAGWISGFADALSDFYKIPLTVHPVVNRFFGETITVAGLLTGADLEDAARRLTSKTTRRVILIPECMLRADEDIFLDDRTPADLAAAADMPVIVAMESGVGLLGALDTLAELRAS